MVTNIQCYDNDTSDPNDDYWTFDIEVEGGSGYWTAGSPINDSGSYGDIKTIWVSSIDGDISFNISDSKDKKCTSKITISPPDPCSENCDIAVDIRVSDCDDNKTGSTSSDDFYTITLTVTGTNGQSWMAKQKYDDGNENVAYQGQGDETVTLTFLTQDGDFNLWVFISDQSDCVIDRYIKAPDGCSNCISAVITNTQCYDNGTSNPNDDYWTFDIEVEGGSGYWTAGAPINDSGSYGTVKTIWVSSIDDAITFIVSDSKDKKCITEITVNPPKPCSTKCDLEIISRVSDCIGRKQEFYVILDITYGNNCFNITKKNTDGSNEDLGTNSGSQQINLGPFSPGEDFTLWIMGCEQFDCVRDLYIQAPECDRDGSDKRFQNFDSELEVSMENTQNFNIYPNPTKGGIKISTENLIEAFAGKVQMHNTLGELVLSKKLDFQLGENQIQLEETAELADGLYIISIYDKRQVYFTERLIKIKQN